MLGVPPSCYLNYLSLSPSPSADCSVCSEGYGEALVSTCRKCSRGDAVAAVVAAVAFSLVGLVLVWYMVSIEKEGTRGGIIDRVQALVPLQSCKIVIVVWQIVTQASAWVLGYCTRYSGGTTTRSTACIHLA